MKSLKLLTGIVLLCLLLSAASSRAYTPTDEGFVEALVLATPEDDTNVLVNDIVDLHVVIKNLTNDTIGNLTITQKLIQDVNLVSVMDQQVTDTVELGAVQVTDTVTGTVLPFTYLNATSSNFTGNIDIEIPSDEYIVISFKVNMTETGGFTIERPELTYYDHWGDAYTDIRGQSTTIRVIELTTDERDPYFPDFEVTEPDYNYIIGGLLAVFVAALLGRMLYFKKPIEM